jgi:hypothetical protein
MLCFNVRKVNLTCSSRIVSLVPRPLAKATQGVGFGEWGGMRDQSAGRGLKRSAFVGTQAYGSRLDTKHQLLW